MPDNNLSNFQLSEFFYVTHLAQLHCTQGSIFGTLNVTQRTSPSISGRASANVRDTVPLVNLTPFGICAATQKPCNMPSLRGWENPAPGASMGGAKALLDCSTNQCGQGGLITVKQCGQPNPFVSTGKVDAKKMRYDARMRLLKAAQAQVATTMPPAPNPLAAPADATRIAPSPALAAQQLRQQKFNDATARLARNNVAVERAKLADDSYENELGGPVGHRHIVRQKPPPEGWKVNRVVEDKESGFMAVEYESNFEQPPRKVLAFRGTDVTQAGDKETDAKQGLGLYTAQYQETEDAALEMKALNPEGFDITGHSLGGGEASLAGLVTGQPTYTFNAAGLHVNSIKRAGIKLETVARKQQVIQAYYSDHDPLSWPQDHPLTTKFLLKAVIPHPLDKAVAPIIDHPNTMPAAVGIRRRFHDGGLHPVVPLVERIEEQKDEDIDTIRQLMPPPE